MPRALASPPLEADLGSAEARGWVDWIQQPAQLASFCRHSWLLFPKSDAVCCPAG
jgi:hypothetical protein